MHSDSPYALVRISAYREGLVVMPIGKQIVLDMLAPPVIACLWWVFSRGWAMTVQAGHVSQRTRDRQRKLFWIFLVSLYVLMFSTTIYMNAAR